MKYAIIDIGSNTIRLSLFKFINGKLRSLIKEKAVLGMSAYVEDGKISEVGIEKLLSILKKMDRIIKVFDIKEVDAFATAAIRNASNSQEICDIIYKNFKIKVDVLSGEDEALYGYIGSNEILDVSTGINIDIGGGSSEIVLFKDNKPYIVDSIQEGSLSLYLNNVSTVIPTKKEFKHIRKIIKKQLKKSDIDKEDIEILTGVGGTIRVTGQISQIFFGNESSKEFYSKDLKKIIKLLVKKDPEMLRTVLKLAPERFHTLTTGIIILNEICSYFSVETIKVSKYGVREGYLLNKLSIND